VLYRDRQGMVPDLGLHGLGGTCNSTSARYYELKGLRASKNTCPRGPNAGAGVAKRASSGHASCADMTRRSAGAGLSCFFCKPLGMTLWGGETATLISIWPQLKG
jgi:hypothetical protein